MRKRSIAVDAWGLPANTEFDTFVIPVPNFPFGVSWYQGDLRDRAEQRPGPVGALLTDARRDDEPGVRAGPHVPHRHLVHSPADAAEAGCSGATTPFNGEHNAGVQVFNTAQFPATAGPLGTLEP